MAVWVIELLAGTIGFIWPNLSGGFGGKVRIGTLDEIKLQNTALPIAEGFPAYVPEARAFIVLMDTGRQQFVPGEDTSGDGRTAECPRPVPALPAPRLQAKPVHQELLARVPVPRIALRPARDQGRRRPVRPGRTKHGSLLRVGRRRRRPDTRHRQDHARAASGRPRSARHHSAADADRLHLMTGIHQVPPRGLR